MTPVTIRRWRKTLHNEKLFGKTWPAESTLTNAKQNIATLRTVWRQRRQTFLPFKVRPLDIWCCKSRLMSQLASNAIRFAVRLSFLAPNCQESSWKRSSTRYVFKDNFLFQIKFWRVDQWRQIRQNHDLTAKAAVFESLLRFRVLTKLTLWQLRLSSLIERKTLN